MISTLKEYNRKITFLGLFVLLCVMIFDDRRDAVARVLALYGGGDHED